MPTGPFDARVKRSRCSACSASHLKCNGAQPCHHCQRRKTACEYTVSRSVIKVDAAKVKTPATFSAKNGRQVQKPQRTASPLQILPSSSDTSRHLYYFNIFVQRNTFITGADSYDVDIQKLIGTEPGHFLVHAVMAIGALQASRMNLATRHDDVFAAMRQYSGSLTTLRDTMAKSYAPSRPHVLWTTLLLGLFELMLNETGDGWLIHMIHGTANALQASGASSCRSGLERSFFLQARVFETSRALLLNEPTFLSDPEWHELTQSMDDDGSSPQQSSLSRLLNIIVQCSRLRVRAAELIELIESYSDLDIQEQASSISEEGFRLRMALETWAKSTPKESDIGVEQADLPGMTLSETFFAAISIYLSGIFDYEIPYWHRWNIAVPTITEELIQGHLVTILTLTDFALRSTNLSPLLFLFPLRIAGSRSSQEWQRQRVLALLRRIGETFTVARIFCLELGQVWKSRGFHD